MHLTIEFTIEIYKTKTNAYTSFVVQYIFKYEF